MGRYKDIRDDEIRIISASQEKKGFRPWGWVCLAVAAVAILISLLFLLNKEKADMESDTTQVVFEPSAEVIQETEVDTKWLGNYTDTTKSYTEHLRDTINDIPLDIYIPHNAVPELVLGVPDIHDKNIVLTTQAADIRADNGKIVGAFVLKGKPLSWGLSKKGYCGIIDNKVTVGVADNSPLFEEATEKGGYFFRQYPLVDNGVLVENAPKGKSIRKALCDRDGEIMVVMSQTPESFHDFAQALVDLQVDNAIYLVGSTSFGYFRDYYDQLEIIYNKFRYGFQYENFIVWRKF
ncbi:MAG: hypothetical protein J6B97_08630 [Bacteroidales bacterium]|nr:hypothetical protein [Bacteroidales bacterium]